MQKTKSNEQQAYEDLSSIANISEKITVMRERISLIEFGMLKEIEANNPNFDFHSKASVIAHDEGEKKEVAKYLEHTVRVPIGYKSPSASVDVHKMRERIYASTKYLEGGGKVSNDKSDAISDSRTETLGIYSALTDRLENYVNGTPDKTMINRDAIQATIDAGGDPFKKTESLVLSYAKASPDAPMRAFAANRSTGNQGEYPTYNFPSSDPTFSVVKGDMRKKLSDVDNFIIVSGDFLNQAIKPDADKPHKSAAVTDDYEAAALGFAGNFNRSEHDNTFIIAADVRSLKEVRDLLKTASPKASISIYTDSQTDEIKQTNRDGSQKTILSAARQAIELSKENSKSDALSQKYGLMLNPTKHSMLAILTRLKERADEKYPDDEYQAKEQYRTSRENIVETVKAKGKEHTDILRTEFKGTHLTESHDLSRKAERDSRLNARINPDARTVATEEPNRPAVESVRETIAASTPDTLQLQSPSPSR